MSQRWRQYFVFTLPLLTALSVGCGGGSSLVQATAPGPKNRLSGSAPSAGSFTLFRAAGIESHRDPRLDPLWTVSLSRGQRLGFRWITDPMRQWSPAGGFRLEAYAGSMTRDLGSITDRDIRYVWATSEGDAVGYVRDAWGTEILRDITMR